MWAAGAVAAMSSITFPAVSALVSRNAESDQQGEFNKLTLSSSRKCFSIIFLETTISTELYFSDKMTGNQFP